MAAKKNNPAPKSESPSAKKARVSSAVPDGASQHPTLTYMVQILNTLEPELQTLATQDAEPFAGITAFNAKTYAECMSAHHEYECNVTITRHKILHMEHRDVWPTVGAIKRLITTVFSTPAGEPLATFPRALVVRTVSVADAPDQLDRLHGAAYLFAFLATWANAKTDAKTDEQAKVVADFSATARRIRTRFLYLPDDDAARRAKWNLQEMADSLTDNAAMLVGYKKTLGVVEVQKDLQSRGLPCQPKNVVAWFATVQWSDPQDQISARDVSMHVRVFDRLSATPKIMACLDVLESRFGRRHALTSLNTLDILCSKTNVKSNPQLSATLLLWVIEGTVALMLRGCIKPDVSRDTLVTKIAAKLLLVRRVVMWLLNRFKYVPQPGVKYLDGFEPDKVGKTLFGDWAAFHKSFPLGMSMDPLEDGAMPPVEPAFRSKLAPSQTYMLEFLRSAMSCQGDVDGILSHSISQDPVMSAESFSTSAPT